MAEQFKLTAEKIADWLAPHAALEKATEAYGDDGIAKNAILECLRGGRLQAAAKSSAWEGIPNLKMTAHTLIDSEHWTKIASEKAWAEFWLTSQIRYFLGYYKNHSGVVARYYGVRFEPQGFEAMLADAAPKAITATLSERQSKNKGGRPPKEWWGDFWIGICWKIYEGDLKPKTQAELAKAMHDWVENHPTAKAEETTIKAAARKLFTAWKLGSKT